MSLAFGRCLCRSHGSALPALARAASSTSSALSSTSQRARVLSAAGDAHQTRRAHRQAGDDGEQAEQMAERDLLKGLRTPMRRPQPPPMQARQQQQQSRQQPQQQQRKSEYAWQREKQRRRDLNASQQLRNSRQAPLARDGSSRFSGGSPAPGARARRPPSELGARRGQEAQDQRGGRAPQKRPDSGGKLFEDGAAALSSDLDAAPEPERHGGGDRHARKKREHERRRERFLAAGEDDGAAPSRAPGNVQPQRAGGKRPARAPRVLKKVSLPSMVQLGNLTNLLGVKLFRLQRAVDRAGLGDSRPERLLTAEDASLLAMELNFDPVVDDEAAFDVYGAPPDEVVDESVRASWPLRPPVTGIFGHVNHGKTSLLDALRKTTVASGEAGGITQHIGAFEVKLKEIFANLRQGAAARDETSLPSVQSITFLDTPGHAAFTAMRERGTRVTDIVVLVVAADDGVKPQTKEVIKLIQNDKDVGVVVALTKVDKHDVNIDRVMQELMAEGLTVEAYGGDVPCVEVSSHTKQGLPELVETIAALAEIRDLRAPVDAASKAQGRVLESRVEKGRGNVATVLVTRGTLKQPSPIVAGTTWCRVRQLQLATGDRATQALPGQPVEVSGWKDLPQAGDEFVEAQTEDDAKRAIANRIKRAEQQKMWQDVDAINDKRRVEAEREAARKDSEANARRKGLTKAAVQAAGQAAIDRLAEEEAAGTDVVRELNLIIKADVSGTIEAVSGALGGIGNDEARVKVISTGVGDVQESDVEHAKATGSTVIAFNVKASRSVIQLASRPPNPVTVHTSDVIYKLVDVVRKAVGDLLPKLIETRVHGEAKVLQLFEIKIKGQKDPLRIAGARVSNGVFQRARKARVIRNGETLFTGPVANLKQVKKDVTEIQKGVECGISLDGFSAFEPDDVIQSIEELEVPRTL